MKILGKLLCLMIASGGVAAVCEVDLTVPDVTVAPGEEWCYSDMLDLTINKLPDNQESQAESDFREMRNNNPNILDYFEKTGAKYCLHPALMAAIASKESRLDKDPSRALLPCTGRTTDLSLCYKDVQRRSIEQVVNCQLKPKITDMMQKYARRPGWSGNKIIQAAIHVWHYGTDDIDTFNFDEYNRQKSFSYDVIIRTQYLTRKWAIYKIESNPDLNTGLCSFDKEKALRDCEKGRHFQECIDRQRPRTEGEEISSFNDHACRKLKADSSLDEQIRLYMESAISCMILQEIAQGQDPAIDDSTVTQSSLNNFRRCLNSASPGFCKATESRQTRDFLKMVLSTFPDSQQREYLVIEFDEMSHQCGSDGDSEDLYADSLVHPTEDVNETCSAYGGVGDCRFFECFDQRFPCDSDDTDSHQINFEVVSCVTLTQNANYLGNTIVQQFVANYEKCMTGTLLPFYTQASVKCSSIRSAMLNQRAACLRQANFCSTHASNSSAMQYFLSFAASLEGYPGKVPRKRITMPLSKNLLDVPVYYYQQLIFFWRAVKDVLLQCHGLQGKAEQLYQRALVKDENGNDVWYYVYRPDLH